MPTLYEIIFWICSLIMVIFLWGLFSPEEEDSVSKYELDRLNGNKY